jgi:protease II
MSVISIMKELCDRAKYQLAISHGSQILLTKVSAIAGLIDLSYRPACVPGVCIDTEKEPQSNSVAVCEKTIWIPLTRPPVPTSYLLN